MLYFLKPDTQQAAQNENSQSQSLSSRRVAAEDSSLQRGDADVSEQVIISDTDTSPALSQYRSPLCHTTDIVHCQPQLSLTCGRVVVCAMLVRQRSRQEVTACTVMNVYQDGVQLASI